MGTSGLSVLGINITVQVGLVNKKDPGLLEPKFCFPEVARTYPSVGKTYPALKYLAIFCTGAESERLLRLLRLYNESQEI